MHDARSRSSCSSRAVWRPQLSPAESIIVLRDAVRTNVKIENYQEHSRLALTCHV